MGSLKTLALAGSLALGVSAAAQAADLAYAPPPPPPEPLGLKGTISSGIYLRGDIGVGIQSVGKYHQDDVASANGSWLAKEDRSTTFFGGLGVGYRFNNWFRVDGTFEYRGGGTIGATDQVDLGGGRFLSNTYKGNMSSMVALFNGYVDLGTWNCLTPYIGAGIGYASNRIHGVTDQGVESTLNPGGWGPGFSTLGTAGSGSKTNVAWALMAGVGYEVNKNLTLELGYRYLNLGDAQSGRLVNAFTGQVQGPLKVKDIDSHDFRIGMRWNFGDPNCCGPVEREPIAYAPPPVVRKY
jgi:opacity protein-like surface antigen